MTPRRSRSISRLNSGNRLDAIIRFKPLAHALILKITDKFLKNVAESLRKRNVEPVFTSTLRNYLAEPWL